MGLLRLVASKRFKRLTGISYVARSGYELLRGDRPTAALLAGAAVLAFRSTWAGVLAELGIRAYRRKQQQDASPTATDGGRRS